MKCIQCGEGVGEDAKFCTSCGAAQDIGSSPPKLTHGPPPPPLPTDPGNGGILESSDDWDAFFQSLGSEHMEVTHPSSRRYEFSGKSKIKTLLGRTTLRYQAVAVIDSTARTLQWWEKLSESSFGMAPGNAGVTAEMTRQKGTHVQIKKSVQTPGGGYAYHYGDLRSLVEAEARSRGWELAICLRKP